MSWRVVVVQSRSKLELKNNYLVIRSETTKRVFIDEISVLVIENTGSAVTVSLLATLWEHKVVVIFCDGKRNPGAQLIPYYGSYDCSARLHTQMSWTKDFTDLVWTEIIRQKIKNQAKVLKAIHKEDSYSILMNYTNELEPGDITNREGHAAKVYFNSLFGSDFTRSDDCFQNYALNYGYGALLSTVNREIVANGYLTQLGIFHSNIFNQFNLGCDLMEPFRPLVDYAVMQMDVKESLEHKDKMFLIDVLNWRVAINQGRQTVLNAIAIYVKSVLDAIEARDLSQLRFADYAF